MPMPYSAYTIEHIGNCIFIKGSVPADALQALIKLVPEGSFMSADLARMAQATFAFGPKDELDALKAELGNEALLREQSSSKNKSLSPQAIAWLAKGERGISSNTMFTVLTGIDQMGGWGMSHPYDLGDFRRCRLLLKQCPDLAQNLSQMSSVSPQWKALVAHWDGLCRLMDEECPEWDTACDYKKLVKTGRRLAMVLCVHEK